MKIIQCQQGTQEWIEARLGRPTASQAHRILTPKTLKPSSSQGPYLAELVGEWAIGRSLDDMASDWMQRGIELEAEAVAWFEFEYAVEVERVGFCLHESGFGCSPDGLVGDAGGLEIKNPSLANHIGYWLAPGSFEAKYKAQVQASLWTTGREWWDLVSYSPVFPKVVIRITPDPDFHEALSREVTTFTKALEFAKERYRKEVGEPVEPPEYPEPNAQDTENAVELPANKMFSKMTEDDLPF